MLMNESCEFALESLKLPLTNVLKDLKPKDFFCPGSMLTTKLNKETPLTYGLAEDTPILYQGVQAYAVKPGNDSDDFTIAVSLPEEDMLRSGWLIGENKIGRKAIVLEAKLGKGRVVMIGFRCQFRAQTNATFKLLFNALYN